MRNSTIKLMILAIALATCGCMTNKEKLATPNQPEVNPKLRRPEVRKVWVPDQIVGDEYIQGHFKFLIDRPAVWTKDGE